MGANLSVCAYVLLSDISLSMKARLGSIDANSDMWLRLMLGGPMHEMGVEYTEAIAVLLKRISSRMWDRDISDIAVDRARQGVRDRTTLHWVTCRHIKNWYLQRAVLAGYDRVLSAARVTVNAVVGGGGEGETRVAVVCCVLLVKCALYGLT